MDALIGRTLGGSYQLKALLGQGAMGAVYRAAVSGGGQDVAVKVLNPGLAEGEIGARFLREAAALQKIRSPHVVQVLAAGQDQSSLLLYLVMPVMNGHDVEHLLQRVGPLQPITAVRIALQAAQGLADAHAAGIVHRDIKPSNLFLEELENGKVMVRVCDFGIAKQEAGAEANLTRTGSQIGTPDYMSPEQLRSSKHVDARTDVWSLGVTLYEMLCGHAPASQAASIAELLEVICLRDATSIQDVASWVEPALASVLHGALRRDVATRWPDMQRFADLLLQLCGENDNLKKSDLVPVSELERASVAERADPTDEPEKYLALAVKLQTDHDHLLGHLLGGRYKVLRELGRGGMGAVFEVEGPKGERLAAKVMSRTESQSSIGARRFAREARSASAIDNPHVVRTLEIDADEQLGVPFIVMELLAGTDLAALLKREGPLDPEVCVRLFLQACEGLRAAHERQIVHRDIKPANLFLQTDAQSEVVTVKVCDFGVAKRQAGTFDQSTHELTHTGGMLGSPMYMSPEQARNAKSVDHRTDMWSLSVALWEALAGRRLWGSRSSLGELILAICSEPIPRLEQVAPWLPRALADAVHRGLDRDTERRWAGIGELMRALEPFAGGRREVTRSELKTIDAERRSLVVNDPVVSMRTVVIAGSAHTGVPIDPSTMGGSASESGSKNPRASRSALVGAALGTLVAAAAAGLWLATRAPASPEPGAEREVPA
ncbi:MAG TPA: serine/threonine-protein kinase, partial [Polyangiaceae bacterium]|nr:serine/threonine-protein kinase [Polyangiaceae bacterium]